MRLLLAAALLVTGAPALAQGGKQDAKDLDRADEVVCKREAETGSLVKRRKTCMTRAEWAAAADSQQTGARRMVEELQTKPSGQ